jgi:CBS domain-containing protein
MTMDVASLCHREVVGIPAQAPLREAAALMCEEHVGSLVVVTGDKPPQVVGILTDRDLALDVLGRDRPAAPLCAGDLAKGPPVAVQASASLAEAVAAMEKAGVRRLLVVEEDGGVVGLVAAEDLMAAISEELAGLARALRSGIRREKGERGVIGKPAATAAAPPDSRNVYAAGGAVRPGPLAALLPPNFSGCSSPSRSVTLRRNGSPGRQQASAWFSKVD